MSHPNPSHDPENVRPEDIIDDPYKENVQEPFEERQQQEEQERLEAQSD